MIIAFLISFALAALFTPGVITLARRMGWVARPREDRWHKRDIALLGGVAIGVAAGVTSGMLGVGGGIVFVPGLVFVRSLSQLAAEATSLLAIVPVAIVGAWRQRKYGNVRLRAGLVLAALSPLGVIGGAELANVLPSRVLELSFAAVQLVFAFGLARRAV
jgi:uncharacterized membrane protein YfcA